MGMMDPVTKLKGNYDFRIALSEIIKQPKPWTVLVLGIDEFKGINDLYSYSFGDQVLAGFARQMTEVLPKGVELYRLDGDGFGVLFCTAAYEVAQDYYELLRGLVEKPMDIDEARISFTISAGISVYPTHGEDDELLYRNARMALRTAKAKGKNQLVVYADEILEKEHFRMRILGNLRESVKRGFQGFSIRYQPLVYAVDRRLYGCEALLRWENANFPEGASPYAFIPVLENSGLILEVGKWVLESAVKQQRLWEKWMPGFQMNVNVSSSQFENPEFKFFVVNTLAKYGVNPSGLTLELTESGQITDPVEMRHVFDFIRGQGIKIALDDFGTGYASLGIFRVLSADELKIDRSFLERISYDVTDQKIIAQIVNLCHSMNMTVCVEGIETPEIESIVCELGAELLQGYYYNEPLTSEEFASYYFPLEKTGEGWTPSPWGPERGRSMVYAPFRPAQPMSMSEIMDNAHAGIFQVGMDHEFTFLTCNEGYRRMLGYTAKQMDEKFKNRALGFVYDEDVTYVNEEIRHQLSLGDTVTIEFRVVKADGQVIWILGTGNVVKSCHGGTSLIVVIVENDRFKKRTLEMEKKASFHKRILDHIPTGMKCVRFDTEFTIDYISPGFLAILGYTQEEVRTLFDGKYIHMIYEEDRKVVINDILEQLKVSNVVTMHYRSPCKDGRLIWMETVSCLCEADDDGIQRAYSSVIDVSDSTGAREISRGLNVANRYQSAVQQWGDVLFEYDFQSGTLSYSDNFKNIFGRSCLTTVEEELRHVYAVDRQKVLDMIEVVRQGKQPSTVEIRVMLTSGEFRWYSVMFTLPDRFGDIPVSAIGKMSDIDAERRERDQLLAQSQRDLMTGLLNKGTVEERVRCRLSSVQEGQQYALYIIDIDDFKQINDKMGHINGDKVICEIASRLQSFFREEDMVGRAGGDEFLVFIPYVGDDAEIIKRTDRLMDGLREKIMIDGVGCAVSVSVGIACYPDDGTQFYDLFRRADSALYRAKELGKDGYCLAAR